MGFTNQLQSLQSRVYFDLFGGPKVFKMRHVVNLFKGATFPFVVLLMVIFKNYSLGMYLYLALHGSYGIIWILKDAFFPDKSFDNKATFGSLAVVTFLLIMYWMMPVFIASGIAIQNPSNIRVATAVFIYAIGAVLMIGSDGQKNFMLKYRKGRIFLTKD